MTAVGEAPSAQRAEGAGDSDERPVVLHVLEAIAGGTSRHLVDLVRHTFGVRHIVAVPHRRVGAVPDRYAVGHLRDAGAEVHFVEMRRNPLDPHNARAWVELALLVRRLRPDVVHGHSAIGGAIARALPLPPGTARCYTPNGLNGARSVLAIERWLARRTDRMIAVSASEGRMLRELGLADDASLVVIPNSVEPEVPPGPHPDLRTLGGAEDGAPLVGTVARLLSQKAPERFVECARLVAARRRDVRFLLIGDGPLASEVDAAIEAAGLLGVFVRAAEVQGVAPALGDLDVFILLSRFEGGPYSPLEAARGGTPIVLSDAVGNVDVVGEDLAELVVPDGDPQIAADLVLRLIEDDDWRARVVQTLRARVRDHFDVARMGRAHRALYESLGSRRVTRVEAHHASSP